MHDDVLKSCYGIQCLSCHAIAWCYVIDVGIAVTRQERVSSTVCMKMECFHRHRSELFLAGSRTTNARLGIGDLFHQDEARVLGEMLALLAISSSLGWSIQPATAANIQQGGLLNKVASLCIDEFET